ncbi:MAG: protein translocase subunit SecD [Alphaproteobacteria bacterium]|nr:protein translocase subunit SecD [Alphaproteobacteria bacterium]
MIQIANWNKILIAVICALGLLYAIPNFFDEELFADVPEWLPGKQINLGLDLQGGSHLLLEVDVATAVTERLEAIADTTRRSLRTAKVRYQGLSVVENSVVFRLRDASQVETIKTEIEANHQTSGFTQIGTPLQEVAVTVDDNNAFSLALTKEAIDDIARRAVEQSIEIIRRRVDETGTREPTIQQQGRARILVQLPGVKDPERIKKMLGQTAKLTFHLVDQSNSLSQALQGKVPPGSMLLPSDEIGTDGRPLQLLVRKRVRVSGDHLVDAQPSFQDNRPVVSFRFDTLGGRRFGDTTRDNVGRLLAIVLDKKVISAPRIQSPILGGSGIITGNFSVQESNDLSLLLRAGALPAPLVILEERTVGPGLGRDSIEAGKIASIIGMILVLVFMVVSYGLFGFMANIALFFNIALIMALLSALQATLTLPGIAGIVLTIGMAVDANVLIFERIREEVRNGRTPISAVDSGYRRALTTIVDANVTTLIAAVLLYAFGTGPIKGFAVTLTVGLVTSMFTAIMVTRLFVVLWLRRARPQALPI